MLNNQALLDHLSTLWHNTLRVKSGPFFRLRNAAKSFAITFEDPFILIIQDTAYSVDEPLDDLKHLVRDSYRQHLLTQAALRRYDCQGKNKPVYVPLTRSLYFSQTQPLKQTLLRQILTGSVDHTQRLFKSNLTNMVDETARHIFWECSRWSFIRNKYPKLIRFFHLVGSQWPNCFLHCGWVEQDRDYGFSLLDGLQISYITFLCLLPMLTHNMYLHILLTRHESTKVLLVQSTPQTPPDLSLLLSPSSPLRSRATFRQFLSSLQILVNTTTNIVAVCQQNI